MNIKLNFLIPLLIHPTLIVLDHLDSLPLPKSISTILENLPNLPHR